MHSWKETQDYLEREKKSIYGVGRWVLKMLVSSKVYFF